MGGVEKAGECGVVARLIGVEYSDEGGYSVDGVARVSEEYRGACWGVDKGCG